MKSQVPHARYAVVDTNVLVSALMNPVSIPGQIAAGARRRDCVLFAPIVVAWELERVIPERLRLAVAEAERAIRTAPVAWIYTESYGDMMSRAVPSIRDPDDAHLVAAALALRTGVISGDKAFHPLREPVVPTWKPRDFLDLVLSRGADAPSR